MAVRVLYVNAAARMAGAEHSLLQLLRGLDRRRFEPLVALPRGGPLSRELARLGIPCLFAPLVRLRRSVHPLSLLPAVGRTAAAALALRGHIVRQGVSLVHAQGSAQAAAGPAAALAGVPCLWHLRDLRRVPLVTPALGAFASGVIAVSGAVLDASGLHATQRRLVHVVPNAIDADAFAARARPGRFRRELGLAPDEPLLLVAAQMVPWKGQADFLHALALVRGRHPRTVAALAGEDLFGDHPGYGAELRRLAEALGLGGAVRFLGHRTDIPTLMADADVVVIPSRAEPFGRVALEAMAVGTPVAGRAAGGLPEVVKDGLTGRLARGDSPQELAEVIGELLADPAARAAMGEAGRRRVRRRFDAARHVARVCRLYRRLLAARR